MNDFSQNILDLKLIKFYFGEILFRKLDSEIRVDFLLLVIVLNMKCESLEFVQN